jgi:general secretion pathway protein D
VLKLDPKNDKAMEMEDNIDEARRQVNARDYVSRKREAYLKWKEQIEETRIPYFGVLTEASEEEWARITRLRSSEKVLGIAALDSPENRALRLQLKNTRSDFNFEDDDITTVANVVHSFTGIPIVVNGEVRIELEDNAQTVTLTDLKDISVESLLNIIVEQIGEGLTWTIRKGVVEITKQEKLMDDIQIRIHPIKDITFGLTKFRGPVIGQITPPDETGEDAETSIFGGELEKETPIPPEDVLGLIQENIARETWDMDAFSADVTADQGGLLIIHTPQIQKQVVDFLNDLRKFSSSQVTIESRFIRINDSFIQEIGADFRGLGNDGKAPNPIMDVTNGFEDNASAGKDNQGDGGAGANPSAGIFFNDNSDGDIRFRNESVWRGATAALGDTLSTIGGGAFQFSLIDDTMFNLVVRAVEKSLNATEITSPIITAFNTQRAYITVINQVSFIQGFDVDVATSAFIANPNVGIIQEGIVLDVRPTVSYDRKYITLEIQTTVADLLRPIRERSTPLAGQTTPVTFQLPELEVASAATTVVVPDGGSLILGGLKTIRYYSRKSETPILGKIPILGFFFKSKGISDEVANLMILARAYITDMNEIRSTADMSY